LAITNRIRKDPKHSQLVFVPFLLLAALLIGCGGGIAVPSTAPVRGVVKHKGKPAPGVRVTFHPEVKTDKPGFVPIGETGPDGSFTLSTGAPSNGAPPGEYVVTFEKPVIAPARETNYIETEVDAFRGKYSDPEQSKVRITVSSGENALAPFELD
jgi:hypothetical protein